MNAQKSTNTVSITLSDLQKQIINTYQKEFPVCTHPHRVIARNLKAEEADVLAAINNLNKQGILSRIGPVFDHKKAGASTLAAISVNDVQADDVAAIINSFNEVNHNYKREHHYNLWFVVTAQDDEALDDVLYQIEKATGRSILVLPMEASYHIDLGFNIDFDSVSFDSANFDPANLDNVHSGSAQPSHIKREH